MKKPLRRGACRWAQLALPGWKPDKKGGVPVWLARDERASSTKEAARATGIPPKSVMTCGVAKRPCWRFSLWRAATCRRFPKRCRAKNGVFKGRCPPLNRTWRGEPGGVRQRQSASRRVEPPTVSGYAIGEYFSAESAESVLSIGGAARSAPNSNDVFGAWLIAGGCRKPGKTCRRGGRVCRIRDSSALCRLRRPCRPRGLPAAAAGERERAGEGLPAWHGC